MLRAQARAWIANSEQLKQTALRFTAAATCGTYLAPHLCTGVVHKPRTTARWLHYTIHSAKPSCVPVIQVCDGLAGPYLHPARPYQQSAIQQHNSSTSDSTGRCTREHLASIGYIAAWL
eukprot:GHRR01014633.1.p1 GENE.GHRR01014633.1~~GHRR01014633.1.p1  ORF type:complete len:119 (-),score=25.65 GHRR01014633.1:1254-1610(-)